MDTVWKYRIEPGAFVVQLPRGAAILSAHAQHEQPYFWAQVTTSATPEREHTEARLLRAYGTGEPLDQAYTHTFLGTFFLHGGSLVFHLFELTDSEKG